MGRLDLPDPVRDEDIFVERALAAGGHLADDVAVVLCTCTLACEPRGITEEQTCKESASCLADTLVSDDPALD